LGIIALVFLALMVCYAKLVWSRIPFATANLKTGTSAIRANSGIILMAYVFPILAAGWTIMWALAVTGIQDTLIDCKTENDETVCTDPNYGIWFVLFVSFFSPIRCFRIVFIALLQVLLGHGGLLLIQMDAARLLFWEVSFVP
jgi:hypothetical protein